MTELIQRYAAALYDLAQTDNMGLTGAAQELLEQEQLWKVLTSSAVRVEEKKELIRSAAPLAGLEPLQAFLCLLAEEGHLDLFPDILEEVHQLELAADGGAVCVMTCAHKPDQAALDDVRRAVCRLRNLDRVVLQVKIDPELLGGFVLEVQGVTYDRSVKGRLERLAKGLEKGASVSESMEELMGSLRDTVKGFQIGQDTSETGRVLEVGDGIATVRGLDRAVYGELVEFDTGVKGMVMDLSRETVGCVLLGREEGLGEGSRVTRTGHPADVPVGRALLGRVVDAMGRPIDGLGPIHAADTRPIEREASGVISRQAVNVPLQTGILAIDSMIPIGRGQRELLIGDRQTGKTSIATDTILNQKDTGVLCIYVAIGQKASSIARVAEDLKKHGAMGYTTIVAATASDSAPLQYIAPYAGTALAEYFMAQGKSVLIVYDDLSKHAVAYRAISLLLRRSPGREAYPGDVFYLHSRLLERSCRMRDDLGGGSITALPIVETQAGDVSAYIPTNVISITDGQIFLETALFNAGNRPAVNVGLSVSRVGGAAQTKAMKKANANLRIELAQYKDMESFSQFSSDLDAETRRQLEHGKALMELLKQPLYQPKSDAEQVVLLTLAAHGVLDEIKTAELRQKTSAFVRQFRADPSGVMDEIQASGKLSPEQVQTILNAWNAFAGGDAHAIH